MQIKTKQQLLDEIKKCREKINKGELFFIDDKEGLQAFNEGARAIEQLFAYDALSDRRFPDLDTLKFESSFENFLISCKKAEDLKKRLDDIAHELTVCAKAYNAYSSEFGKLNNLQEDALNTCAGAIDDCLTYQKRKTSKKFLFFKSVVVGLICVALVFTILSFFEPFKEWSVIVGTIIGALDFCFGLGFQIYERKDDMAQKSKTQAAQSDLQVKREQINAEKQTIDVSVVNETHGNNSPIVSGDNNKFNY